jgi:predicted O-methyltransferase YrrM
MEQLRNIIETSQSAKQAKRISQEMYGSTFHHHFHILWDIRTLLGDAPKVYTEIGTFCGGSLCLMLQHPAPTEVVSIDPMVARREQTTCLSQNIEKFNIHSRTVRTFRQFSTDPALIQHLKNECFTTDILFIDGDHSYRGVLHDFETFAPFVNPGGYIVFDDYADPHSPQVKPAVDAIVKTLSPSFEALGTMPNIQGAYDNNTRLATLNEYIVRKV